MLLCDFSNLEREIRRLEDGGAAALHLDVMDGRFVPNFTYGITIVEACRKVTELPLDVHLMIVSPEDYLVPFAQAGADQLTVHAEAVKDLPSVLQQIRELDAAAGVAFNLGTPPDVLANVVGLCDTVLAMSVRTGFGGQKLDRRAFATLKEARNILGPSVLLEIDGGVNLETVAECRDAGAELLVAGAAIFRAPDYGAAIHAMEAIAAGSPGTQNK
jgi:ribulose-phosphate 3-epimerase